MPHVFRHVRGELSEAPEELVSLQGDVALLLEASLPEVFGVLLDEIGVHAGPLVGKIDQQTP